MSGSGQSQAAADPARTVAVGCDHAGLALKAKLSAMLAAMGFQVLDIGTYDEASVDYPDIAGHLVGALSGGRATRGVLICGSGIGMSMAANRHAGIRAALCHDGLTARLARQHNDANVLCLGARIVGEEVARDCLQQFVATPFEGGRHGRRVAKMA